MGVRKKLVQWHSDEIQPILIDCENLFDMLSYHSSLHFDSLSGAYVLTDPQTLQMQRKYLVMSVQVLPYFILVVLHTPVHVIK